MKNFYKNILTGKDNATYDISRVMLGLSTITFLGISIFAVIQGQIWHPMEFGTGLSAILAGGGAGIGLKAHTEPECHDND